jgi:hypothetical protein
LISLIKYLAVPLIAGLLAYFFGLHKWPTDSLSRLHWCSVRCL